MVYSSRGTAVKAYGKRRKAKENSSLDDIMEMRRGGVGIRNGKIDLDRFALAQEDARTSPSVPGQTAPPLANSSHARRETTTNNFKCPVQGTSRVHAHTKSGGSALRLRLR